MARRKVSKSKTNTRSKTTENGRSDSNHQDSKIKDDPGGGIPPVMENISDKKLNTIDGNNKNQQQQLNKNTITTSSTSTTSPNNIVNNNNNNNNINNIDKNNISVNSSDSKYLHKKFKRIASATIDSNNKSINNLTNDNNAALTAATTTTTTSVATTAATAPTTASSNKTNPLLTNNNNLSNLKENEHANNRLMGSNHNHHFSDSKLSTGTTTLSTREKLANKPPPTITVAAFASHSQQKEDLLILEKRSSAKSTEPQHITDHLKDSISRGSHHLLQIATGNSVGAPHHLLPVPAVTSSVVNNFVNAGLMERQTTTHSPSPQQQHVHDFYKQPQHHNSASQNINSNLKNNNIHINVNNLYANHINNTNLTIEQQHQLKQQQQQQQMQSLNNSDINYIIKSNQIPLSNPQVHIVEYSNFSSTNNNYNNIILQQQKHNSVITSNISTVSTSVVNNQLINVTPVAVTSTTTSSSSVASALEARESTPGRYVCPYCQMNCTKPSVLQKHIRAHTNERPYPCSPCGFAFKTRSNLYKHCRSRAHIQRVKGEEPNPEDEGSLGSDLDVERELSNSGSEVMNMNTMSPMDDRNSSPLPLNEKPYKPKFHNAGLYSNANKQISVATTITSTTITSSRPLIGQNAESLEQHISKIISDNEAIIEVVEPPLQKKYHKITGISRGSLSENNTNSKLALALMKQRHTDETPASTVPTFSVPQVTTATSNVHTPLRLSQISSMNYHYQQQQQQLAPTILMNSTQQPLNLVTSKVSESSDIARKRSGSENFTQQDQMNVTNHPQNPERSIIKDLLLNSRNFGVVQNNDGDQNGENSYTCQTCKVSFRGGDFLKYHTICYCQGNALANNNSPQSAPISPVSSPSHQYLRSNSFHVNLPEKYNPNSLKNLATSLLRSPVASGGRTPLTLMKLAKSQLKAPRPKPDNIVLTTSTSTLASSSATTATTSNPIQIVTKSLDVVQTPLPSPGPLLGNTRLVDTYSAGHSAQSIILQSANSGNISNANNNSNKSESSPYVPTNTTTTTTNIISKSSNNASISNNNNNLDDDIIAPKRLRIEAPQSVSQLSMQQHKSQTYLHPDDINKQKQLQLFGGELTIIDKNEHVKPQRFHSGGTMSQLSPDSSDMDGYEYNHAYYTGLQSGGSIYVPNTTKENPQQITMTPITPKLIVTITPTLTPTLTTQSMYGSGAHQQHHQLPGPQLPTHFQFPPINSITGFNPLTLPLVSATSMSSVTMPSSLSILSTSSGQASQIMHGGKLIPFVPGIPGPNTIIPKSENNHKQQSQQLPINKKSALSPNNFQFSNINNNNNSFYNNNTLNVNLPSPLKNNKNFRTIPNIKIDVHNEKKSAGTGQQPSPVGIKNGVTKTPNIWSPIVANSKPTAIDSIAASGKKSFNFTRIADNLSPVKTEGTRYFNFDNLIKSDAANSKSHLPEISNSVINNTTSLLTSTMTTATLTERIFINTDEVKTGEKFLRPTSLPLKPGTFTPKRHHGITPTANTLPLISPETPRPSKTCHQLYLNGHAYTYLGLKCSTKTFYCTVNKPQPVYVSNKQKLSMYSNWQVYSENNPHPLGFKSNLVMSLYDSRQQSQKYTIADSKSLTLASGKSSSVCHTVSSQSIVSSIYENPTKYSIAHIEKVSPLLHPFNDIMSKSENMKSMNSSSSNNSSDAAAQLAGGFESTEDYTYVRGRGRGKYVCGECGIRCKKPSMLKKHIRTHTDVRPYTCQHCEFSFKTKGNLTKHMKSKAHYKKCVELGISPIPILVDDDMCDNDMEGDQQSISSERTSTHTADTDSDDDSDGDDGESESSDTDESKSRLPEHEAAHCLLSLSMTPPTQMNLTTVNRSVIYTHNEKTISLPVPPLPPPTKMGMISPTMPPQATSTNDENNISNSNRRIITFSSPKSEFDLLKHEQYYSDPNLNFNKKSNFFMDPKKITGTSNSAVTNNIVKSQEKCNIDETVKPMDLTKRKDSGESVKFNTPKVSDVVTPIHGANLLSSLVQITDKIPVTTNEITNYSEQILGDDNNQSYQEYLTERALFDFKMKQSQMNRGGNKHNNAVRTPPKHYITNASGNLLMNNNNDKIHGINSFDAPSKNSQMDASPNVIISFKHQQQQPEIKESKIDNMKNIILETSNKFDPETESKPQKPLVLNDVIRSMPGNEAITITTTNASATLTLSAETEISGMETLAEIAAHSVKLDTSNHQIIPTINQPNTSTSANNSNSSANINASGNSNNTDNAKSVASEYLKLTKTKAILNTNSNNVMKSDDSNGSDQELTTINPATITAAVALAASSTVVAPMNALLDKQLKKPPQTDNKLNKVVARTVVVGEDCFKNTNPNTTNATNDFNSYTRVIQEDGGRPICIVCNKKFQKISHLRIHMNIHYMERKFRCEACAVSFRTQGHLLKHERSVSHHNKVSMTSTFGVATVTNPRPFKCKDCKIAFRIHGHLAKHLRSKMHVLKLECLQKLPFGTYAEIERAGINLTDIDTTDCDNSLVSLRILAQKLHEKDPTKLSAVNLDLPARGRDGGNDSADSDVDGDDNGEDDECFTNTLNTNNSNNNFNINSNNNIININNCSNINTINNLNTINNSSSNNINVNDNNNEISKENSTNTNISINEVVKNPMTTSPPTTSIASTSTLISTTPASISSTTSSSPHNVAEKANESGADNAMGTTTATISHNNLVSTALKRKIDENSSVNQTNQQQQQEKKIKLNNSTKISNSNDS